MKNIKLYPSFSHWLKYDAIYIISDTHFDDSDCKLMDPDWITPEEHIQTLKKELNKQTLLLHLGDVGRADYLDELKCYKVLITGNHDVLSKVASHFDEVYTGPLFIVDRILLSHEPIYGLEDFCVNIHGHNHNTTSSDDSFHINLAANVANYTPMNLGKAIKEGLLSSIKNIHRITIDKANEK
jgi:calcineurin-like phosphoesterase family protein